MTQGKKRKERKESLVERLKKATTIQELGELQREALASHTLAKMQLYDWAGATNTPRKEKAINFWANLVKKSERVSNIVNYKLERLGSKEYRLRQLLEDERKRIAIPKAIRRHREKLKRQQRKK